MVKFSPLRQFEVSAHHHRTTIFPKKCLHGPISRQGCGENNVTPPNVGETEGGGETRKVPPPLPDRETIAFPSKSAYFGGPGRRRRKREHIFRTTSCTIPASPPYLRGRNNFVQNSPLPQRNIFLSFSLGIFTRIIGSSLSHTNRPSHLHYYPLPGPPVGLPRRLRLLRHGHGHEGGGGRVRHQGYQGPERHGEAAAADNAVQQGAAGRDV